ncbi:hypothetical protein Athai_51170 [Actinocatenispora thailandica]|uniref:Nucleoside phosphorylase domain-containing protein n=1 Tax=Actinocatenispora thailandica TaxID=227318 RepID=A0A7R7DTM2_9ACTN|nr:hypothetical protein [Actinocatenispora thailandica]BCJ37614.1 hypothetical protein Athai_51170 [Actinocatenispora thailandica]
MTVLLAPMRAEARALRRGGATGTGAPTRGVPVLHAGVGPLRAARAAARLAGRGVCVAGVGGGLVASLHTGDVVVAEEVRGPGPDDVPVRLRGATELAALLRAAGHPVHIGPVGSRPGIVAGAARDRLAGTGALAVDTESYWLLSGPARPVGCLRVVADCAPGPVFGPATLWHLGVALRRLRALAGVLTAWAATADPAPRNESHQPLKEAR